MNTISQSIVNDRQHCGMTQDQLAKRLGVSQQAVSNWEEGKAMPRGKRLRELSALFGKNSQTAMVTEAITKHTRPPETIEDSSSMGRAALPTYANTPVSDPMLALTQAANDIAFAAKALAHSAEQIAQAVTRLTKDH